MLSALLSPPARAQEDLEIRVPVAVLRSLTNPGERIEPGAQRRLLSVNPWADRVSILDDPNRFSLTWELPGGEQIRLAGSRIEGYRLLLGTTARTEELLGLPEGYRYVTATRDEEEVRVVVGVPAPPEAPEELETVEEERPSFLSRLGERVSATLRLLGSHRYQEPSLGGLNPENRVLGIPRQISEGEARFDLALDLGRLHLSGKPRALVTREHWQDGPEAGESETDDELFLLEGAAQLRVFDTLFASYGRENLQWGPGQLVNPSNPFLTENGRENPLREVRGTDFARLVWLPNFTWTLSWISNLARGEAELQGQDWHPSHAVKIDYLGYEANGGVVFHAGPDHPESVRVFGQWTASDALLLYGEAAASKGSSAHYPTDAGPPIGTRLEATRENDPTVYPFTLVGGSYTFLAGPTLSLEYVFNGEGYHSGEADEFFDLAHAAGTLAATGAIPQADPDDFATGLRLLRRNYLFFQYLQTEIANRFNVLLRWTQNLDDQSGLATGFGEWNLSDRWRLFAFAAYGSGGNRDEFGSVVRYLGLAGLELSAF